jgi:hypothetical protein
MKYYLGDLRETCRSDDIDGFFIIPNIFSIQINHYILDDINNDIRK